MITSKRDYCPCILLQKYYYFELSFSSTIIYFIFFFSLSFLSFLSLSASVDDSGALLHVFIGDDKHRMGDKIGHIAVVTALFYDGIDGLIFSGSVSIFCN